MKGRVEVIKDGQDARFSWTPDDGGTEWDVESLRSLLASADVRIEVTDDVLQEALAFLAAHDAPAETDVVARGVEAVAARPLTAELITSPLPEDVESSLGTIMGEEADETALMAWAEADTPIAVLNPPVAARAGLALNRDPIAPPETDADDLQIGDHLDIRGNHLIAERTGIVRMIPGSRIELIPCRRHLWSLSGSPDDGGCFLDYQPGHSALAPPSAADIVAEAGRLGFLPEKLRSEDELRAMVAEAVEDEQDLAAVPVSRDADGLMAIDIDDDRLRADLRLRRQQGDGRPLILKDIAALIRESGLRGLDGPAVKSAIMEFWNSESPSTTILLKEGVEPERGPDRTLESLVPYLEEDEFAVIRDRLASGSARIRGLASLKEFPLDAVTHMARTERGQVIGKLGPAKTGKPGRSIDGRELPGYPGNDPDIRVHEGLEWDGDSVVARADGILDTGKTPDGVTRLRIRPHEDALIQITVSEDKLKAFVSTRLPEGSGAPVDAERIRSAAEAAGVVRGLSDEAVEDVVERSRSGEIITGHLIAEGRLPMEGGQRLSLSVSGDPAKQPVPVRAGEEIGTLRSSGEESGWNVLGEAILEEGNSVGEGENIERREDDDGTIRLIAAKGGHLTMGDGRLLVKDILDFVGDVSMASGNIRFPGRIKVDGSVLSRVIVDGGEGVEISQVVQAALVNSSGDIFIGKGVKGEGKAVLRCQGRLTLGYAEDANLLTTGDIFVSRALMNCRVKCNGRLEFSGESGKLVGGILKLKDGLVCREVGNARETETVISFGQDYLVDNQIEQTQNEIAKIQEFIGRTDEMMAELDEKGAAEKLIAVRKKKVDAMKMLEKKNRRLFLLREKFERHFESEVRITGTAWPGVTIESHGRIMKITESTEAFRVRFDPGTGRLSRSAL